MRTSTGRFDVLAFPLRDDGTIPNNERLPLLFYRLAIQPSSEVSAEAFEQLFAENGWTDGWRNGVYSYHHYHSTAHEVLGVYSGSATIQFGGENGIKQEVGAGDAVVIPAGVAHKNLGSSFGFGVVGAYPRGQQMDMCYGKKGERPRADENIARVPLPQSDPLGGERGSLLEQWK